MKKKSSTKLAVFLRPSLAEARLLYIRWLGPKIGLKFALNEILFSLI